MFADKAVNAIARDIEMSTRWSLIVVSALEQQP